MYTDSIAPVDLIYTPNNVEIGSFHVYVYQHVLSNALCTGNGTRHTLPVTFCGPTVITIQNTHTKSVKYLHTEKLVSRVAQPIQGLGNGMNTQAVALNLHAFRKTASVYTTRKVVSVQARRADKHRNTSTLLNLGIT
jgi:hypothetical protein